MITFNIRFLTFLIVYMFFPIELTFNRINENKSQINLYIPPRIIVYLYIWLCEISTAIFPLQIKIILPGNLNFGSLLFGIL